MKKLVLVCCMMFGFMLAHAQTKTVTGTVTNENGEPLSSVSVQVQGRTTGVITTEAGTYSISAASTDILEFIYVGYGTVTRPVGESSVIDVQLTPITSDLNEVVVVGYGTQRRENLTGAVVSVNVEEVLGNRPIADAGRGLQGAVPGLSVVVPSGEVGSDPIMRIRGQIGSIAGSGLPLILVDNVEIPSIQMVNPNDIETITVLKDAAASSIYGAKAAFGVILITTKKGSRTQGATLTYSNNLSWQQPAKDLNMAGIDGMEYTLEAHKNMKGTGPAGGFWRIDEESLQKAREWEQKYGSTVSPTDPVVFGRDWGVKNGEKFGYRIYDVLGSMVKNYPFSHNHNLSLNGKTGETTYNIGLGYFGQQGMMQPAEHDDFTRYTANLKLSTKVTDFLTVRGGLLYSDRTKRFPNSATGFGADPWLYLYRWGRLYPTGIYTQHGEEMRDPYWDTKNAHTAYDIKKYTNLNLGTTIQLNPNWDIVADYTYDIRNEIDKSSMPTFEGAWHWYAPIAWNDDEGNRVYVDSAGNVTDYGGIPAYRFPYTQYITKDKTYIYQGTYLSKRHTVNAYSTYNLNLDRHKFKFMLGTNVVGLKWDSHWSRKTELINEDNPQFNFAVGTETSGGGANWESLLGYFGRINYSFDDKYLVEANLRYDGTSKFPAHLRWKWYPSFSAGWVLSNEEFMQALKPTLSFAKLRASWGTIGDQSVPNSLYLSTMNIVKNSWLTTGGEQFFQMGTPNPISAGITWQDIESTNFGVDLRFFNSKFGVTFDLFQRETKNMIIAGEALPSTYGAGAPQGNYGNLRTRGFELVLDYNHRFENGFGINLTANLSDAVTKITKAADWNTAYENRRVDNMFVTGKTYGDIYGYVTDRLFQKEDFVYDADGNIVQTTIIWQGTAKVTNQLAGENPVYQTYFEDGNQILLISPGDVKFVDVNGDGYITPGTSTFGDPGDRVVIGNFTPRYEYGFRLGFDYKGFDLSIMGQGVGKRHIWGDGQLAIPGYHVKDGAMPQTFAGDFWKADRTNAFYPRAWHLGGGNSGFVMVPQTRYLLNMAYFRIKNMTLGYNIAPHILENIHLKQARVFVSLENFITFDKLRGLPIDPEAISGYSMLRTDGNYNLGRTGTSNPVFKIASVGVNITL